MIAISVAIEIAGAGVGVVAGDEEDVVVVNSYNTVFYCFLFQFGFYIFMMVDWYIATFNILFTSLIEVVIVAWIYGTPFKIIKQFHGNS